MKIFMIIFSILSGIFAVGSLVYVAADIIYEITHRAEKQEESFEPAPEPEPEPIVSEPPKIADAMPAPVESVSAEEADEMISDSLALSGVLYEEDAQCAGKRTYVNIGVISSAFEAGDTVDIDALKRKGLIPKDIKRIKVLADGVLSKPLTVKANAYSVQAVKMIELTGGTVVVRRAAQNR